MLKAIRPLILCLIVIGACQKSDIQFETPNVQQQVLSKKEINDITHNLLTSHNQFKWSMVSDQVLWSAGMQSDSIFAVGYQPEGFENIEENIHLIDIDSDVWLTAKNRLYKTILEGEEKMKPGSKIEIADLLPFGEPEILPSFAVRITNINTITKLRAQGELRYLEAMGYYPNNAIDQRSDSGCGVSPNYNIPGSEYTSVLPSAKVPWNFYHHNIPTAWNQSTGDGVRVVIIDTGTSSGQNNLGSQFNSGYSQNRNVTKISTLYTGMWWWKRLTSPHDECGHGTQMAGMATGPRSTDGNSVGVAYNADLLGIHATQDVIISSSNEKNGVKNALIVAGNNSSVRVISMSIGTIFWSGTVADGIYYAYNRGKMIMAAAGTSTTFTNWFGVIFPASMSQTVAITGVQEGLPLNECSTCHYGSAVDFVAVMQRNNNNDRTTLTLAPCCDQPSNVGGSSAATSMTAGIAALVWGKNPSLSRSSVLSILKNASQFYPSRDSDFGWGMIDAAAAVAAAN
jgi:hypothetical protein